MPSSKKKKSKNRNAKKAPNEYQETYQKAAENCHRQMTEGTREWSHNILTLESRALLNKLRAPCELQPEETRVIVRQLAILAETNVEMNDNDPYGDGDQSLVGEGKPTLEGEATRQILRELFAVGGDLESHLRHRGFSEFGMMCCLGNAKGVANAIRETPEGSVERMQLLERRESGMRLSPILLAIAISKCKPYVCGVTGAREEDMDHVGVVRALLRYGAQPTCRDLTGKTVVHYGAGCRATAETLIMTDYLLEAAKTCAYFGKRVILRNLTKEEYNGLTGTLGGFVAETGRREVILEEGNKQLALLPKNIFSFGEEEESCIYESSMNLLNIHDRFGDTSLHEVFLSDRTDVAEFLVKRNVSVDVAALGSPTIRKMVNMPTPFGKSKMHIIIHNHMRGVDRVEDNRCWECSTTSDEKMPSCNRCRKAIYCSRECQKKHWPSHKHECRQVDSEYSICLSKPPSEVGMTTWNEKGIYSGGEYRRPDGVEIDEQFWIKVQCASKSDRHMVYDRTRTCQFYIFPGTPGHLELYEKVIKDKTFDGRKLFFKAAFDSSGNCKVYPNITSSTKSW